MATLANYDYDTENSSLQRRQKLLDAMMGSMLQPMQQPNAGGRIVGRTSPLAAMLPALGVLMQQHGDKKLEGERAALTERYKTDLNTGMGEYMETSKTDNRAAIQKAMASNHPVLREFAMSQAKKMGDGQLTAKDLATHADGASVLANPSDPKTWKPKEELGEVGGIVYDKRTKQNVQLGGPAPVQKTHNGDLYEQNPSTGQWKKLDNAPKVSTHLSVSPVMGGQKAGMEQYFKNAANQVDALGKIAGQASANKQSIAELANLDSQGIYSNVSSGPATFLANLGEAAGIKVDTKKLGNTEAYNAITTDLWQGLVAKFGGNRGVTKEEALEIKKMLPQAIASPQARQQLFKILGNVADRQIQQYETANTSFAEAAQKDDPRLFKLDFQNMYDPAPNQPNPTTKPAGAKPSVSNW